MIIQNSIDFYLKAFRFFSNFRRNLCEILHKDLSFTLKFIYVAFINTTTSAAAAV
jgi:hypothetical protein